MSMSSEIAEKITNNLKNTSVYNDFQKAMNQLKRSWNDLYQLAEADSADEEQLKIQCGNVLVLAFLQKICSGRKPQTFNQEDWKDIANQVLTFGFENKGGNYSAYIFNLYAQFIDASLEMYRKNNKANLIRGNISSEQEKSIHKLSDDLRTMIKQFENGEISESDFVENSMWTALEAMMKLWAAQVQIPAGKELNDFKDAILAYFYAAARLKLYREEQHLLEDFYAHRQQVDAELQLKYEEYQKHLREETRQFMQCVEHAFDSDFRERLRGSVLLAETAGVRREQILHNVEEVDDFFLG